MICRLFLCAFIVPAFWVQASISAASDVQCPAEYAEWSNAYRSLETETENLRTVKNGNIGDRVRQDLEKQKKGTPIAKIIREILTERSDRLSGATQQCKDRLRTEQILFDRWRKCSSGAQKRQPQNDAMVSAIRDRNRLHGELSTLMMDEAYAQYKKEAPLPVASAPVRERHTESDRRADYERTNSYFNY